MADGDYERGRARELSAIDAALRRLRAARRGALVLNGWAASPQAWSLCRFPKARILSYTEQLDGEADRYFASNPGRHALVGWSMGGSMALRLACDFPARISSLLLIAATPRMMEDAATGWKGMSERRLEALRYGLVVTGGEGFMGIPEGRPNPYLLDAQENLERGLEYLRATDLRDRLKGAKFDFPVEIFQSERDGIVRAGNAAWLAEVFPGATVTMVPGSEHALPVSIPEAIDAAAARLAVRERM